MHLRGFTQGCSRGQVPQFKPPWLDVFTLRCRKQYVACQWHPNMSSKGKEMSNFCKFDKLSSTVGSRDPSRIPHLKGPILRRSKSLPLHFHLHCLAWLKWACIASETREKRVHTLKVTTARAGCRHRVWTFLGHIHYSIYQRTWLGWIWISDFMWTDVKTNEIIFVLATSPRINMITD